MINCTRTEEEEDFLRPGPYLIVENSDFYLSVFCLCHPWISGLHFFVSLISNKLWHFKFLLVFPFKLVEIGRQRVFDKVYFRTEHRIKGSKTSFK